MRRAAIPSVCRPVSKAAHLRAPDIMGGEYRVPHSVLQFGVSLYDALAYSAHLKRPAAVNPLGQLVQQCAAHRSRHRDVGYNRCSMHAVQPFDNQPIWRRVKRVGLVAVHETAPQRFAPIGLQYLNPREM
jgi:hypothetical protein